MWRVAGEVVPAIDGARFEFGLAAHHVDVAALALPDRQREAVVALLGDHPVVHVAQPVELALHTEGGHPVDAPRDLHHVVPQLVHRDEPLIDDPEDQLAVAAPADRIAVRDRLNALHHALLLERGEDGGCDVAGELTLEFAVALDVVARLIEWRKHW